MLNEQKFAEGMGLLCAAFDREPTALLLKAYYMVLKSLTDEQFGSAIRKVLSTHEYSKLPLPADIMAQVHGDKGEAAIIALDKVEKAIARHGAYTSVKFDDPIIHAVIVALGGWPRICGMSLEEWKWARKDFEKTYKAFVHNADKIQCPEHLCGIAEISNSAHGFKEETLEVAHIGFVTPPPRPVIKVENRMQVEGGPK